MLCLEKHGVELPYDAREELGQLSEPTRLVIAEAGAKLCVYERGLFAAVVAKYCNGEATVGPDDPKLDKDVRLFFSRKDGVAHINTPSLLEAVGIKNAH